MPFGISYDIIATLARWSLHGFYREIRIMGYDNVPKEGPLIVCCTHNNMIVDPAILATTFPHKRKVHFWAKNSLFANKALKHLLLSGGVVPVDRTTKNNQALFAESFKVLKMGEIIAVFPEGTSHSESQLLEFKDGASWAAMEYAVYLDRETNASSSDEDNIIVGGKKQLKGLMPASIIPCGITYVQKSKYRSMVIVAYGPLIQVEPYLKDFEIDSRTAIKMLTKRIRTEMEKLTINSPNWGISNAATMTRLLLFSDDKLLSLEDFVRITQCLINFYTNITSEEVSSLKTSLNQYKTALDDLYLLNADIKRYERNSLSISRAFYSLIFELFSFLIEIPFFLPGIIFHWPIYVLGKISVRFEKYEESMAQNKIFLGLAWLMISYLTLFLIIWISLFRTSLGVVLVAGAVFIFAWYHIALVDSHYDKFKELFASFRMFSALCSGKGSKSREQIEGLAMKRRICLDELTKISKEYRSKNDDLRFVLELSEKEYYSDEKLQ